MSLSRVAILSSAGGGGAGIAARRFADTLNAQDGHQADFIDIASLGDHVPQSVSPQDSLTNHTISDTHFTVEQPGDMRGWFVDMLAGYDLVMVHWASYLISLAELHALAARGTRILFQLHDFHYLTGGCHYPAGCNGYHGTCSDCPQVDRSRVDPLQMVEVKRLKQALFAYDTVHLAAPSQFLRDCAVASGMVPDGRAHVLRNPYVPLADFDPDRGPTRRLFLIADSLTEGRKNMDFALDLLSALTRVDGLPFGFTVDVVGAAPQQMVARLSAAGVPHVFHGRITDHARLTQVARQADILLTPSLEDNWPNILVEAGAYGAMPVVGPGHGCAEFVQHYAYGEIARDYTQTSFLTALVAAFNSYRVEDRRRATQMIRRDHDPVQVLETLRSIAARIPQPASGAAA